MNAFLTFYGSEPVQLFPWIGDLDIDVLGTNCSVGPGIVFASLESVAAHIDFPLAVIPDAGMPKCVDGRNIYLSSPEYFQTYARRLLALGVRVLGGCCGITPEHIKAMGKAVGQTPEFQAATWPSIAGVWSPASQENAEFAHHGVPAISVPEETWARKHRRQEKNQRGLRGLAQALAPISAVRDAIAGVQVSAPLGRLAIAREVIAGKRCLLEDL